MICSRLHPEHGDICCRIIVVSSLRCSTIRNLEDLYFLYHLTLYRSVFRLSDAIQRSPVLYIRKTRQRETVIETALARLESAQQSVDRNVAFPLALAHPTSTVLIHPSAGTIFIDTLQLRPYPDQVSHNSPHRSPRWGG